MVAAVKIRVCTPAELPALVALLDEEFIHSRGRNISLAQRFPDVLSSGNCRNILIASRNNAIAAALACKRFDWITPARVFKGAMLGLVYTHPNVRRLGLASHLLQTAAKTLTAEGMDFAVLFSVQSGFYLRLGWTPADRGCLGRYASTGGAAIATLCVDASAIEALRSHQPEGYAARSIDAYRNLPLPAERIELRACPDGSAYAIYGLRDDSAYVYEIGGSIAGYDLLWQGICAAARDIYINECEDSPSMRWLEQQAGISWHKQMQAMWLPLAARRGECDFSHWYIPYLDRI